MPLLTIETAGGSSIDNVIVNNISYPILEGGYSTASFSIYNTTLSVLDEIVIKNGATTIFEGRVIRCTHELTVTEQRRRDYEAICKSYYDYSQNLHTVINHDDTEEDFIGNGVEFEEWKVREDFNKHVTWPPHGNDPIIFDDQSSAVALPANVITKTNVIENDLPSHCRVNLRVWKEKRFPTVANFEDVDETAERIKNESLNLNFGKSYKIMSPDDASIEFTDKPLYNAEVGGTKIHGERRLEGRWL